MKRSALLALLFVAAVSQAQTNTIRVPMAGSRSDAGTDIDAAVRAFAKRAALLTKKTRKTQWRSKAQFSLPVRVEVVKNGNVLRAPSTRADGDIVLSFNTASGRTFDSIYQQALEQVYADAKPYLDSYFGKTLLGGTVLVSNYDADLGDRSIVAGGVYIPNNGSGTREIRFPVYNSLDAARINFIHTLLLAYQGNTPFVNDAWQEGLVRAVTAKVVRALGLAGKIDANFAEGVLYSSYDVGGYYDWYNQPALSGKRFIAPNLLSEPLPLSGSPGGLYLLRYRMSGAAWEKVLVQYPEFAKGITDAVRANPTLASDEAGLVTASQGVTANGVEGLAFPQWYRRQEILDTVDEPGTHLALQPEAITSGLAGSDYGVFNLGAILFDKDAAGNETLRSGTAFPIFWGPKFNERILPGGTSQYDQIDFSLGYGSVGPNFDNDFGGIYRVSYDLSAYGVNQRVYLPVGAIATASQAKPNNFYGTVSGLTGTGTTKVRVLLSGTLLAETPVTNGAFGTLIGDGTDTFTRERALEVQVVQGGTTVLDRFVNKAPGDLELDLRIGAEGTQSAALPAGASAFGMWLQPYRSEPSAALNVTASNLLLSHYDPLTARWALYPDSPHLRQTYGHAVRLTSARTVTLDGVRSVEPSSVALSPGWNLVVSPIDSDLTTDQVSVVTGTEFPVTYSDALGTVLGRDAFLVNPGAVDPASGLPETLAYTEATSFPKGRAMFVRCVSADGGTILFGKGLAPALKRNSIPASDVWRAKLVAIGSGVSTQAYASMSRTATRKFDLREDSALPPSQGGFQISVGGNYRDARGVSSAETYAIRLDGLVAGKTYSIVVTQEAGYAPRLSVYDPVLNRRTMIPVSGRVTFTATGTSRTLTLTAEGVR
ncbi:hypothetical protein BH11ARM2_BH11ARM2_18180 [soil metagenome]